MNISLNDLISNFPGIAYYKNTELEYMGGSHSLVRVSGLGVPKNITGRNDYDFCWDMYADEYRKNDSMVLSGERLNTLQLLRIADGNDVAIVSQKAPIYDAENNIVGVLGHAVVVTNDSILSKSRLIKATDLALFGQRNSCSHYLVKKIDGLTKRQSQCLFYLLRGKSARKIAEILHISPRTVEYHIGKIKEYYNVSTHSDIIDIAFKKGLIRFMPIN